MGYQANDEDEEEQKDEPQLSENDTPALEEDESEAPSAAAPPQEEDDPEEAKMQIIKDKLAKDYASAEDDSGVKAAQEKASHLNTVANIGDALESMFKSNSMAHGGAGVDSGFYQGFKAQGAQGVQQAQAARNAKLQDFLQQHEINRQVAQDMMTKGNYDQQQKAAQYANDVQDPNSRTSKNSQQAFTSIFKGQPGISDMDVSQFSAADLASASKNADVVAKLNELKATKQMQMDYQNANLKDKKDQKQEQLYTDMSTKAIGGRGAPPSVQKAASGIQSGKRAMDLIDRYPDPNKMPPQQVHLLNTEIDSMAKSGASTEGGIHGLEAHTMQSNWAKFISSVDGEPTGAQLGKFINENKAYLQSMMKTNEDAVRVYKTQVYNSYKKRLTPEQDALFKNDNPEVFKEEEMSSAGQGSPTKTQGGMQAPAVAASQHPDADKASAWANKNPNDPRAKEILKRLGTMNAGL